MLLSDYCFKPSDASLDGFMRFALTDKLFLSKLFIISISRVFNKNKNIS